MSNGQDEVVYYVPATLQVHDDMKHDEKNLCAYFTARPVAKGWLVGVKLKSSICEAYQDSDLVIEASDPVAAMQSIQTITLCDGVDDIITGFVIQNKSFQALFTSSDLKGIVTQPFFAPRGNQPRPHLRLTHRRAS